MIRPSDSFEVPAQRKPAVGLGVVVLMHVLFFWALHAGLGRELMQSAPVVVVAQLLSDAPRPVPLPAPEPALTPEPKSAPVPPPKPAAQAPALEPSPTLAAVPAIAVSAAPAVPSAPPAPSPPPAVAAPPAPAAPAAPAVRVAATLQASGNCQKPEYPPLSQRREEQGSVVLKFLIGVDGRVLESHVEQTSGYTRLDEAARLGLAKCQFKPGTVDGKPEPSWANLKYTWRLNDTP